jgi:ABC-2 type transport system permease protein
MRVIHATPGGGALVAVFLQILVLPALLPQFGYDWLTDFADLLPGTNAFFLRWGSPPGAD